MKKILIIGFMAILAMSSNFSCTLKVTEGILLQRTNIDRVQQIDIDHTEFISNYNIKWSAGQDFKTHYTENVFVVDGDTLKHHSHVYKFVEYTPLKGGYKIVYRAVSDCGDKFLLYWKDGKIVGITYANKKGTRSVRYKVGTKI